MKRKYFVSYAYPSLDYPLRLSDWSTCSTFQVLHT